MRIKHRADPSWLALENVLSRCGPVCAVSLDTEDFAFSAETLILDNTFVINVNAIRVKVGNDIPPGGRKSLEFGQNPTGLNSGAAFVNLVSVLMTTIDENLSRHPELKKVRLVATDVVNRKLATLLNDMGFIPQKVSLFNGDAFPQVFSYKFVSQLGLAFTDVAGIRGHVLKPLAIVGLHGGALAAGVAIKPFTFKKRSWVLELPVAEK